MFGFFRTSVCSPEITPGDVASNGKEILRLYRKAVSGGASIVFFPSLALAGESAGELFFQASLLREAEKETEKIAAASGECAVVFGAPVRAENSVFDCFIVAQEGKIRGVIPSPDFDARFFASPALFPAGNADGRGNQGGTGLRESKSQVVCGAVLHHPEASRCYSIPPVHRRHRNMGLEFIRLLLELPV